jgi:hypothetical protein
MTEQRFDELINLYLDNEIGRSDVGELKHAIKDNLVRRRKFERACQLHQAARKALTLPPSGVNNEDCRAGAHSAKEENRPRKSSSGGPPDFGKSKQSQARRNASVGALAERQEKQGVASTVEVDKINLESCSGRQLPKSNSARNFTFFDSPLGMMIALLLATAGCAGLYLILHSTSPVNNDDSDKSSDALPISLMDGGDDPKAAEELAAEVKKHKATTGAADAMRERLYQSALTGQTASNDTTMDYFSPHLDPTPSSSTTGNAGAMTPASVKSNTPVDETSSQETTTGSASSR